jgi:hypothetical protein
MPYTLKYEFQREDNMSSVVIWRDKATGVTASWNKQAPHSVFVPVRIDQNGICDGRTTEWRGEKAAIRAAEAAARERLEEMRAEDPGEKRFRLTVDGAKILGSEMEIHGFESLRASQRFAKSALAEIDALPVTGTFEAMFEGEAVIVLRVQ